MTAPATPVRTPALHGPGLTDVRMMIVVHRTMRRELGLSAAAVRRVADADRARCTVVADHVDLFLGMLHHHHTNEDERLWAPLAERVPAELAPLVHLMGDQHASVDRLIGECYTRLAGWRDHARSVDGAALATALEAMCRALFEHLDTEEAHLLPIMAREVTEAEWAAFEEEGMSAIPQELQALGLGMMLYEGDPEVLALQLAKAPVPRLMRPLLPVLGRRAFRRYARQIHGTPTPPRGVGIGGRPVPVPRADGLDR